MTYTCDTSKLIEVGDLVSVNFNNSQYTLSSEAIVLRIPKGDGDSWGFECRITGDVYYVSEGCTIRLLNKGGLKQYC